MLFIQVAHLGISGQMIGRIEATVTHGGSTVTSNLAPVPALQIQRNLEFCKKHTNTALITNLRGKLSASFSASI